MSKQAAAPQLMDAWSQSIMSALAMTAELQLQLCSMKQPLLSSTNHLTSPHKQSNIEHEAGRTFDTKSHAFWQHLRHDRGGFRGGSGWGFCD